MPFLSPNQQCQSTEGTKPCLYVCLLVSVVEQSLTVAVVYVHLQGHFSITKGLCVTGKSAEAVQHLCDDMLYCATYYRRLSDFARPRQPSSLEESGLVSLAFRRGLCRFLQHYHAFVLTLPKSDLTLLRLSVMLRRIIVQIRYVLVHK